MLPEPNEGRDGDEARVEGGEEEDEKREVRERSQFEKDAREKRVGRVETLTGARMNIPLKGGKGSFSPSEVVVEGGGRKVLSRGERINGDSKDSS